MKTLRLFSLAAGSISLFLLAFALNYQDPLITQYEQCLAKYMQLETTTSAEEIFFRYPKLERAFACINQANRLKSQISSMTGGPAPNVDQDQAETLTQIWQQFKDLRVEAKNLLDQLQFTEKPGMGIAYCSTPDSSS